MPCRCCKLPYEDPYEAHASLHGSGKAVQLSLATSKLINGCVSGGKQGAFRAISSMGIGISPMLRRSMRCGVARTGVSVAVAAVGPVLDAATVGYGARKLYRGMQTPSGERDLKKVGKGGVGVMAGLASGGLAVGAAFSPVPVALALAGVAFLVGCATAVADCVIDLRRRRRSHLQKSLCRTFWSCIVVVVQGDHSR